MRWKFLKESIPKFTYFRGKKTYFILNFFIIKFNFSYSDCLVNSVFNPERFSNFDFCDY